MTSHYCSGFHSITSVQRLSDCHSQYSPDRSVCKSMLMTIDRTSKTPVELARPWAPVRYTPQCYYLPFFSTTTPATRIVCEEVRKPLNQWVRLRVDLASALSVSEATAELSADLSWPRHACHGDGYRIL